MVSATVDWLVDHLVVPAPAAPAAATEKGEPPVVEAKPPDTSQAPAN